MNYQESLTKDSMGWQEKSTYCWASCVQMVFQYYRINISPEKIIETKKDIGPGDIYITDKPT